MDEDDDWIYLYDEVAPGETSLPFSQNADIAASSQLLTNFSISSTYPSGTGRTLVISAIWLEGDATDLDTEALENAVADAEALLADVYPDGDIVISTNGADVPIGTDWVTQAMFTNLQTALGNAVELLGDIEDDENVTQQDVNAALDALESAIVAFNPQEGLFDPEAAVNLAPLRVAIDAAEELLERVDNPLGDIVISTGAATVDIWNYWVTQGMVNALQTALDAALDIVEDVGAGGDADQQDADDALDVLESAIEGFTLQPGEFVSDQPIVLLAAGAASFDGATFDPDGNTSVFTDGDVVLTAGEWGFGFRLVLDPRLNLSNHSHLVVEWETTAGVSSLPFGVYLNFPEGYTNFSGSATPGESWISMAAADFTTWVHEVSFWIGLEGQAGATLTISSIRFEVEGPPNGGDALARTVFANGAFTDGGFYAGNPANAYARLEGGNIVVDWRTDWGSFNALVWLWPHIPLSGYSYFVMYWDSTSGAERTFNIYLGGETLTLQVAPGRSEFPLDSSQSIEEIALSSNTPPGVDDTLTISTIGFR